MKIVVTTCDMYCQVVALFLKYWFRAWPNCPYQVEVVTNTIEPPVPDELRERVAVHYLGLDEGWSSNMLDYLDDRGTDEPFLLMLEDYIVTEIDHDLLALAIRTIERFVSIGQLRLVPVPGPRLGLDDSKRIGTIDKGDPYAMSLQASMWRPQVFLDLLVRGESPWNLETFGSRRAQTYNRFHFLGTYDYALRYVNYLRRGVPRESAVEWVKAHP